MSIEQEVEFGHLFYWTPVFMGMGAVLWFSATDTPLTPYIFTLFLLFSGAAVRLRYHRPVVFAACASAALLCVGALLAAWESARAGTVILDTPVTTTITGVVTSREAIASGRWRYVVEVAGTDKPNLKRMPTRVTLTAPGGKSPIMLGASIRGRARLLPPSGPALVGLNDFAFDAYFSGTGAIGFFYGKPDTIEPVQPASRTLYQRARLAVEDLRARISARIRAVLPGDTGAFAASMVTDDRRAISDETTEALRLAGLSHIIAISGLNMALAAGIFFVGIRALLSLSQELAHRYPVKKIAAAGALVTVSGYYLISGFAVSAERAYLMMAIMLTATMIGRQAISLRNVALSAIIILALSPSAVMGPGFQMSYAATLALVAGYSMWQWREGGIEAPLPDLWKPIGVFWRFGAGVFVTSLIGGLSTALFSIEHFHRIAVWGLPANLLAMPVISMIVMPAGLAALILMPIGLDWLPLRVMGVGLDLVIVIAKWAASLGGDVVIGRIHDWLFLGLTICLIAAGILRSKLRLGAVVLGGGLVLANWLMPGVTPPDLVVFEDGRLAGLIKDSRIASTEARPGGFIFEQWQRALPVQRHVTPIEEESVARPRDRRSLNETERRSELATLARDLEHLPTGRFLCRDDRWCVARAMNGTRIIVMQIRDLVGSACDKADLVITPARLSWDNCQSGAKLISAESLRRSGTVEIWLDPENIRRFHVVSALGEGDRPWYLHRTYNWRSGEFVRGDRQPRD
jgi:ComEC/Rec2-related protein